MRLLPQLHRSRPARRAGALGAAAALLLLAGCGTPGTPAAKPSAPPSPSTYESFTSYPGWIQQSLPPKKFNFTPWTVVSDFGLWPTKTGGIAVGDMNSLSYIPPAVAYAHQARKAITMAVGGD